jgi:hypothetical protein
MGVPSRHAAVDNYVSYTGINKKVTQLSVNQDIYAYLKTEYLLISNEGEFIKATKTNFLKIFKDDKKRIENFLKLNKPNFNKLNDLENYLIFVLIIKFLSGVIPKPCMHGTKFRKVSPV